MTAFFYFLFLERVQFDLVVFLQSEVIDIGLAIVFIVNLQQIIGSLFYSHCGDRGRFVTVVVFFDL